MPGNTVTNDLLQKYPWLSQSLGWVGFASLIMGSLLTLLGQISDLRSKLFELFGLAQLETIHFSVGFFLVISFVAGYVALAIWFYRRYLSRVTLPRQRRIYTSAAVLLTMLLAAGSIYAALPPKPDLQILLVNAASSMRRELLETGAAGGGVRTNRVDHSSMTQVWTSAQSLMAILASKEPLSVEDAAQVRKHLEFIERVRLPGDEGWGYVEDATIGITEINAWVVLAELRATEPELIDRIWGADAGTAVQRVQRDLKMLASRQMDNGGWAPVNSTANPTWARTYSTTMALWALVEASKRTDIRRLGPIDYGEAVKGGIRWLLTHYSDEEQSWVPNPARLKQTDSYPGLTAQALFVLERSRPRFDFLLDEDATYKRARARMIRLLSDAGSGPQQPLRLRSVSSNDRMHDSDQYLSRSAHMLEGSTFLWFPWTSAFCAELAANGAPAKLPSGCNLLADRSNELIAFARDEPFTYVMAESLFAVNLHVAKPRVSAVVANSSN